MESLKQMPTPSGFGIHDVLYIVFKHKWKIIILSLMGFSVSAYMGLKVIREPSFQSNAKLMVRYVVERSTIDPEAANQMLSGGMSTELEILTSRDTAVAVARTLGPSLLTQNSKNPLNLAEAATKIINNLEVENPMGSPNMVYLKYRDSDPKLATDILKQVILTYFGKHLEFHRNTDAFTQVSRQADEARSKLRLTEEEINQLKNKSGVLTIESTVKEFESRRRTVRESLLTEESRLAEQIAKVESLRNSEPHVNPIGTGGKLTLSSVTLPNELNDQAQEQEQQNHQIALAFAEFNNLALRLPILENRRNYLLISRKPEDPMVAALNRQINEVVTKHTNLSKQYPEFEIANKKETENSRRAQPILSLKEEIALESALKAKLASIHTQAKFLDSEVTRISALGFQLQELERRRQLEEEKYRYFQTSLEKARLDETLDPSQIPNISVIQSPSPPIRSIDDKALKMIIGTAFVGLLGGVALAFLIEIVIDRKVSRPLEIINRLQIPVMMVIPQIRKKQLKRKQSSRQHKIANKQQNQAKNSLLENDPEQLLQPFTATIHDHLLFNFQINQNNHKPKLIALTGLSHGAGTSTIAAGLAKSFSENLGVKVLLVNLSENTHRSSQAGRKTLLTAIEESQPGNFDPKECGLYFASASTRFGSSIDQVLAPADLHQLLPKLITSQFDYIIFDMPPMTQTSPTFAMAGLMDKVLLILDGGNTTREHLRRAHSALVDGRADVSCIFNKAETHAPRWVQGNY